MLGVSSVFRDVEVLDLLLGDVCPVPDEGAEAVPLPALLALLHVLLLFFPVLSVPRVTQEDGLVEQRNIQ